MSDIRIGNGFDVHKLVENRKLILGGVQIPYQMGLGGHSDADVLVHAVMDSCLGALALGDIGQHFPDTDEQYHLIDSRLLLKKVVALVKSKGYRLSNLDSVIVAQNPKLSPYLDDMRRNLAEDFEVNIEAISVKATTTEQLGFIGKGQGMAAYASVLLVS